MDATKNLVGEGDIYFKKNVDKATDLKNTLTVALSSNTDEALSSNTDEAFGRKVAAVRNNPSQISLFELAFSTFYMKKDEDESGSSQAKKIFAIGELNDAPPILPVEQLSSANEILFSPENLARILTPNRIDADKIVSALSALQVKNPQTTPTAEEFEKIKNALGTLASNLEVEPFPIQNVKERTFFSIYKLDNLNKNFFNNGFMVNRGEGEPINSLDLAKSYYTEALMRKALKDLPGGLQEGVEISTSSVSRFMKGPKVGLYTDLGSQIYKLESDPITILEGLILPAKAHGVNIYSALMWGSLSSEERKKIRADGEIPSLYKTGTLLEIYSTVKGRVTEEETVEPDDGGGRGGKVAVDTEADAKKGENKEDEDTEADAKKGKNERQTAGTLELALQEYANEVGEGTSIAERIKIFSGKTKPLFEQNTGVIEIERNLFLDKLSELRKLVLSAEKNDMNVEEANDLRGQIRKLEVAFNTSDRIDKIRTFRVEPLINGDVNPKPKVLMERLGELFRYSTGAETDFAGLQLLGDDTYVKDYKVVLERLKVEVKEAGVIYESYNWFQRLNSNARHLRSKIKAYGDFIDTALKKANSE